MEQNRCPKYSTICVLISTVLIVSKNSTMQVLIFSTVEAVLTISTTVVSLFSTIQNVLKYLTISGAYNEHY